MERFWRSWTTLPVATGRRYRSHGRRHCREPSTAPAAGFRAMSQPAAGREQWRCSTPVLKVPRAMQNGGYSSHTSGEWNSGYNKVSVHDDEASTRAPSRSPAFGSSFCSTRASSKSACDLSAFLEEVEDRKGTKALKNACDRRSSI